MNQHEFQMTLPFVGERSIIMDGKPLQGVTDLRIQAGDNGYTNVILGMSSKVVVDMVSALKVEVNDLKAFGGIWDKAVASIPELRELELQGYEKLELVSSIIALTIEQANSLR